VKPATPALAANRPRHSSQLVASSIHRVHNFNCSISIGIDVDGSPQCHQPTALAQAEQKINPPSRIATAIHAVPQRHDRVAVTECQLTLQHLVCGWATVNVSDGKLALGFVVGGSRPAQDVKSQHP
jgi:hypothetical protein